MKGIIIKNIQLQLYQYTKLDRLMTVILPCISVADLPFLSRAKH